MKINLMIFLSSIKESNKPKFLMKTIESNIRPVQGDVIDDPGFHPDFHNGYEVVKVTINYERDECYVSLSPLVINRENIGVESYLEKLETNG